LPNLANRGPGGLALLTATEAAARLESGEITSEALVRDCLARIAAREPEVGAWAYIDPDYALEQARARDTAPRRSMLHGVPVGIKDIIDTEDMPTGHGSPIYAGERTGRDSACVASLRTAGMVILGKTVTTEFASPYPAGTRNPHDPARTPGVSSSGSGAAVADFHVPCANGTQTGGSVIGPAASCGVYGYKASLDGLDRTGIRHCKPSIDTLGLFGRSVDDLILLRAVSVGQHGPRAGRGDAPRIGLCRTHAWDQAEPCMRTAIESAARLLAGAGAEVTEIDLPEAVIAVEPEFNVLNSWEGAQALAVEARDRLDSFNPWNRERVEFARTLTEDRYRQARERLAAARAALAPSFDGVDALLTPSLAGEAPIGLTEVRSSVFNRLWTQMYTPCVTLPLFEGPNAMPLGLQIVGPEGSDDMTLAAAAWIDRALRASLGRVPARV
jgi:Asp-tRNA(Asn)/Glu-tRNA(Gln) amidotransferase A subunit family amidase